MSENEQQATICQTSAALLGLYPYEARLWIELVWQYAAFEIPWNTRGEFSHVLSVVEGAPIARFVTLDKALRELTIAGSIKQPAILVELRRLLDALLDHCQFVATLIKEDNRDEIHRQAMSWEHDWGDIERLSDKLLSGYLNGWLQLGSAIGASMHSAVAYGALSERLMQLANNAAVTYLPLPDALANVTELEFVDTLSIREEYEIRQGLEDYRNRLVDLCEHAARPAPKIRIDHPARFIELDGVRYDFSEFKSKANGGLKCFIALTQEPGKSFTYVELRDGANTDRDAEGLSQYISGFLSVIREKLGDDTTEQLRHAYIKNVPKQGNRPGRYWLALSPEFVDCISSQSNMD